ncbi:hypothetical protein OF83DRAFT_1242217 [Amylostereum chailletii]|nr:hypothetical protein OF83DRAFT_1242217 [Amylostereum chailletii]
MLHQDATSTVFSPDSAGLLSRSLRIYSGLPSTGRGLNGNLSYGVPWQHGSRRCCSSSSQHYSSSDSLRPFLSKSTTPSHVTPASSGASSPTRCPSPRQVFASDVQLSGQPAKSAPPSLNAGSKPSSAASSRPPSLHVKKSHAHTLFRGPQLHHLHHIERAVSTFESRRCSESEAQRWCHPLADRFVHQTTILLRESTEDLLRACVRGMAAMDDWLDTSRHGKWTFWIGGPRMQSINEARISTLIGAIDEMSRSLVSFKANERFRVLEPYRTTANGKISGSEERLTPPHRFLSHCFLYQYHLMRLAGRLLEMLKVALNLEQTRTRTRLWHPAIPLGALINWGGTSHNVVDEREDDEDPDVVQGIAENDLLGEAGRRDPDALPPRNVFECIMNTLYRTVRACTGDNVLFGMKAGILTGILSIPAFVKSSSHFAYMEKIIWVMYMGQLTISRFRGDTVFGLVGRIKSTFFGGLVGAAMWYIASGSGRGNPYGMAVTCAVALPFFCFGRLYWPGPPMPNILFFDTVMLIVGGAWQNTHYLVGPSSYYGFDMAWRRFVTVLCGVVAAYIFSFLPPATTLRGYQRRSLATTVAEMGTVYCSIVSYASARHSTQETRPIMQSLIAIRAKLKRSTVLRKNVVYEFSMRGRWPAERYQKIVEIQVELTLLLSHLLSVVEQLEPAWARAFLCHTQFMSSDFQGDVLAVISLIATALRTGSPLPQITPCPLFDRSSIPDDQIDLPSSQVYDPGNFRPTSPEMLENEQYMYFCVGVSTAQRIVMHFDRLMMAVKELVGEQYHISGLGKVFRKSGGAPSLNLVGEIRPAKDV